MKKILIFILCLLFVIFGILLYSRFIGTKGLNTNEITIKTNILESFNGIKIVHFSDLHYKKVITEKRVKSLVKEINQLKPDIVLFTGDLLDKDYEITNQDINFLIQEFSKIESKFGNYSILGDQDYLEQETVQNIYLQGNFTLLKNESTIIYNENNDKILIAGLESVTQNKADIDVAMQNVQNTEEFFYKVILVHEPDYIDTILEKYPDCSLILAAHSINGSINLPIIRNILLPEGAKKYNKPYYKINQTTIYITNGIGVNQVNFRLFNTPSLNFYRLIKES